AWPQYVGPTSSELNGAARCLAEADLVVTVGARVDFRLGFGRPPALREEARFVRIDADGAEVHRGRAADVPVLASPRAAPWSRAEPWARARARPSRGGLARVCAARDSFLREWEPQGRRDGLPIPSLRLIREIEPFLESELTFCLDGGNIGRWAHMLLWKRHPQ